MANLHTRPPAELIVGRHGSAGNAAGASLRVMPQRQVVSVIARRNGAASVLSTVRQDFKADLPDNPMLVHGTDVSFLWCGHQQWFAMANEGAPDLLGTLRQRFGRAASLSDQSDSKLIVELSGPSARIMLAKLVPIDLHPRVFCTGMTALTSLEHVGSQITQVGDEPRYEIMVFRSFADSVLHGLLNAGAEFGVDIIGA